MLRIVAGKYRGIRLEEVKSSATRPTTDKNKEMLFNILGQYFDGGTALDLFAGSGSLGLEAYSRGMDRVVLVDNHQQAIEAIKRNKEKVDPEGKSLQVIRSDAIQYLKSTCETFNLILADPPYQAEVYETMIEIISSRNLLEEGGVLVLESGPERQFLEQYDTLCRIRERVSGNTKFHLFRRENSQ